MRLLHVLCFAGVFSCATSAVQVEDDAGPTTDAKSDVTAFPDADTQDAGAVDAPTDAKPQVDSGPDAGAGVAILKINEVNPNITSSLDLIELRASVGGATAGITLEQDINTKVVLATLPAINVATGDLIVVHLTPPIAVTDETASKTTCINAACYTGAWDVRGGTTGITYSGRLLVLRAPNSTILDGVAFYRMGTASPGTYFGELMALQGAGAWLPANCGGNPCNTNLLAESISADWNGTGTTATGASVARKGNADTDKAADWGVGVHSFGVTNP